MRFLVIVYHSRPTIEKDDKLCTVYQFRHPQFGDVLAERFPAIVQVFGKSHTIIKYLIR